MLRSEHGRLIVTAVLLVGAALACGYLLGPDHSTADEPAASQPSVLLEVKILDTASGLELQAQKRVPAGSSLLEALDGLVKVGTKEYPGVGSIVTDLCGVEPPANHFWALYVDGQFADRGASQIELDRDLRIEWRTQQPE